MLELCPFDQNKITILLASYPKESCYLVYCLIMIELIFVSTGNNSTWKNLAYRTFYVCSLSRNPRNEEFLRERWGSIL